MAGTLQYVGFTGLTYNSFEVLSGPKGMTTRFRVTSPILANLIGYQNYIVTFGASSRFVGVDGGAERELEVEVPGLTSTTVGILTELFFDQWELVSNESSDTIFNNPLIIGGSSPVLNYNDSVVLSRLARDGGTLADAVANCNADIDSGALHAPAPGSGTYGGGTTGNKFQAPTGGAPLQLAKEVLKGQTEYDAPTQVLRHTSYKSAGSNYALSKVGEEKIYTPAQLLTEVGAGWTYNLPADLYSQIAAMPFKSAPADEATYYTWGWRKKIGRQPVLANFMVEVSTEYELNLWSNIRYALR